MPKRIIVCADGTWNQAVPPPGVERTNACEISRALPETTADGVRQHKLYIEGIGVGGTIAYFKEGYTGQGIPRKIRSAYRFISRHYEPGDEIYLFGVSRGAFLVRRLCQMIDFMGVAFEPDRYRVRDAYQAFCRPEVEEEERDLLRHRSHHPCPIKFVGCFDTVDALGLPAPGLRELTRPHVGEAGEGLGAHVENAFHALSIDETRKAFLPTIWPDLPSSGRVVEQVWFAGNHGDVCGGFGKKALSDFSLEWMVSRAQQSGLVFDDNYLERLLGPDLAASPTSWTGLWGLLLPAGRRRILETNPSTEWIHESVVKKMGEDDRYAPKVLRAAFEAGGDSRIVC